MRGLFAGLEGEALREEVLRRLGDETLRSCAPLLSVVLPIDLPDNEIAVRCNLTRDGVAGQLKRIRKRLRNVLEAGDRIAGAPELLSKGEGR